MRGEAELTPASTKLTWLLPCAIALRPFSPAASVRSPSSPELLRRPGRRRTCARHGVGEFGAEHVVDAAVAPRAHAVVGVVGELKSRVVRFFWPSDALPFRVEENRRT